MTTARGAIGTRDETPPEPLIPHSFRVAEDLWDKALEAARRRGTTRSAVLVRALEELVAADELEQTWRTGLAPAASDTTAPTTKEHRP